MVSVLAELVSPVQRSGCHGPWKPLRGNLWDMSASLARFHQLASAVVAFSLQVTAVQAVFKLSQDTPDERWQRVQDGPAADPASVQMARDMVHWRYRRSSGTSFVRSRRVAGDPHRR